jgi:hypothetical protein
VARIRVSFHKALAENSNSSQIGSLAVSGISLVHTHLGLAAEPCFKLISPQASRLASCVRALDDRLARPAWAPGNATGHAHARTGYYFFPAEAECLEAFFFDAITPFAFAETLDFAGTFDFAEALTAFLAAIFKDDLPFSLEANFEKLLLFAL